MKIRPASLPHQVLFIVKELFYSSVQLKKSPRPYICPLCIIFLSNLKPYTELCSKACSTAFCQVLLCWGIYGEILQSTLQVFYIYYKQRYWWKCSCIHKFPSFVLLSWGASEGSGPGSCSLWVLATQPRLQQLVPLKLPSLPSFLLSWPLSLAGFLCFPFGQIFGFPWRWNLNRFFNWSWKLVHLQNYFFCSQLLLIIH